jgi:integrase
MFGVFAGIRPKELERMDWKHVHLDESHILLPADLTKTGSRRVIEIQPTLATWLTWYIEKFGIQSGPITPQTNLRRRLRMIRKTAGITQWVQDVMRHSYASNFLAHFESVDQLRANLGHRSNDVLWRHYHKAVVKKEAAKFWAIAPTTLLPKVAAFKVG